MVKCAFVLLFFVPFLEMWEWWECKVLWRRTTTDEFTNHSKKSYQRKKKRKKLQNRKRNNDQYYQLYQHLNLCFHSYFYFCCQTKNYLISLLSDLRWTCFLLESLKHEKQSKMTQLVINRSHCANSTVHDKKYEQVMHTIQIVVIMMALSDYDI